MARQKATTNGEDIVVDVTEEAARRTPKNGREVYEEPTNDAENIIEFEEPYTVSVSLTGAADMLFHRWSVESVEAKGKASKGSAAKKTDDVESYVWRDDRGRICLPGEYVRQSIIGAAKFRQDPRSPRKSAQDLFKAGVVSLTTLAPLNNGIKEWEYLDRRRVTVQRNGITRHRPAVVAGWTADFEFMVLTPEYINSRLLHEVLNMAGRLVGVADFRPTYGRFLVSKFQVKSV